MNDVDNRSDSMIHRVSAFNRVLTTVLGTIVFIVSPLARADDEVSSPASRPSVVGYFAEWNDAASAASIRADLVTHVIYSFARIQDGVIALSGRDKEAAGAEHPSVKHFAALRALKARNPKLKTLISVGGWGAAKQFPAVADDVAARETFACSCAMFAHDNAFDGIDIDWETPGDPDQRAAGGKAEDVHNFTLLLAELRRRLDAQSKLDGHPYLLSIAAPAGPQNYAALELGELQKSVDLINLMTYDLNGGWSKKTDFNAALFTPTAIGSATPNGPLSTDAAVQAYLTAGVPAEKLVVGVPFYGQAWGDVPPENDGLFQTHSKTSPKPAAGDEWTYRTIHSQHLEENGHRHWNAVAKVPWLYDPKTRIMISYDDPMSAREKGVYAREHKLGGVMIWELGQDDEQSSLLGALVSGLKGSKQNAAGMTVAEPSK